MEKGRSRLTVTAVANGPTNSGIRRSLASRPPYTASSNAVLSSPEILIVGASVEDTSGGRVGTSQWLGVFGPTGVQEQGAGT